MKRHEFIANREESLLLVIDFQAAMVKVVPKWEEIAHTVNQLTNAAEVLDIPILLTEQYIKGLGRTIPEVLKKIPSPTVFEKEHFSACLEPGFFPLIDSFGLDSIVVAGMETHVCVLQTCLDLLGMGYKVHLVTDAVASRKVENRNVAIEILRDAGAIVTSTEIVIFQWARRANTEIFRRLLPIVK